MFSRPGDRHATVLSWPAAAQKNNFRVLLLLFIVYELMQQEFGKTLPVALLFFLPLNTMLENKIIERWEAFIYYFPLHDWFVGNNFCTHNCQGRSLGQGLPFSLYSEGDCAWLSCYSHVLLQGSLYITSGTWHLLNQISINTIAAVAKWFKEKQNLLSWVFIFILIILSIQALFFGFEDGSV